MYIRYSLHVYDTRSYVIRVHLIERMEKWKDENFFCLVVEKSGRIETVIYINLLLCS